MACLLRVARPVWLYVGLGWILVGNAVDMMLTLWGLRLGVIREANPLLAPLLAARPELAVGLKMGVTGAAVVLFHSLYPTRRRLVGGGVAVVGIALAVVMLLHVGWLSWLP